MKRRKQHRQKAQDISALDNTSVAISAPYIDMQIPNYYLGEIQPATITAPLPDKFKGSQGAARRMADGYKFGREKVAEPRDRTVPYIATMLTLPYDIIGLAELGAGAAAVGPTVFKNFNRWSGWSKSTPISLRHIAEYRGIELLNGLRGNSIPEEASRLHIDPRAYVQTQSKAFKRFLGDNQFKVLYKGTPHNGATVFPKPTDSDYLGKLPGAHTGEEGIYLSSNPTYAERYTGGIGLRVGPKTGEVHTVAIGGTPTTERALINSKIASDWNHDFFTRLSSEQRKAIEAAGYNVVENEPLSRWMPDWDEIMVFEPNQIKSLEGNNGNFSLLSRNIYERDGGKIYIKSENRGKFTALKKRTGHSATWFKEHGTPAQKKMATFALNARKWKHGDGGPLDRALTEGKSDIILNAIKKIKAGR